MTSNLDFSPGEHKVRERSRKVLKILKDLLIQKMFAIID